MQIRQAATVMLVRDSGSGPEVCLLRRNPQAVFVAGAHVFPGGAVDESDRDLVDHPLCGGRTDEQASRTLGLAGGGLAYWVAAARECFEEAGVLLARRADGRPLDLTDRATAERFVDHRRELLAGTINFVDLCQRESLILELASMFYLSHWITPAGAPRRYDTRFFVAAAPVGQRVVPDDLEVVADLWATPAEALDRHARGDLELILPTVRSLEVLGRFEQTADVLAALAAAEAAALDDGPALVDDAGGRRLFLPGDADHRPVLASGARCGPSFEGAGS